MKLAAAVAGIAALAVGASEPKLRRLGHVHHGASASTRVFSASLDAHGSCVVTAGNSPTALATATYADSVNSTGWGVLNVVEGADIANPLDLAYAAGCAEAAATSDVMFAYWSNYAAAEYGTAGPSQNLTDFMQAQLNWIRSQISARGLTRKSTARNSSSSDPLWEGIAAVMAQFDGLVEYYARFVNPVDPTHAMSELDLYFLNSVGDLEDLNTVFPNTVTDAHGVQRPFVGATMRARGRAPLGAAGASARDVGFEPMPLRDKLTDCSAMISVLEDNSDVVLGHTTWRMYYAMLRVYKVYSLPSLMPRAASVSFSSSPGLLHSKDDFYATDSKVVMETTNSIFNETLYSLYITPQSAFTWQRVYAANGWAADGKEWLDMFAQYNSGTYNNQWMVADYNRFTPGVGAEEGFLHIIEQIPGTTQAADVTDVLTSQGHWPSYNIPYFPAIYDASGYPAKAAVYGPEYTYENCSRANIFRRNASDVTDLLSLRALLRYNDFQHDPLSNNDPIVGAVSSRGDLRAAKPVAFGGVDTKVVSLSSLGPDGDMEVLAESGPTYDQQPVFAWKDFPAFESIQHDLVPAVFDFPTVSFSVE